jgi:hypothetical protein
MARNQFLRGIRLWLESQDSGSGALMVLQCLPSIGSHIHHNAVFNREMYNLDILAF